MEESMNQSKWGLVSGLSLFPTINGKPLNIFKKEIGTFALFV